VETKDVYVYGRQSKGYASVAQQLELGAKRAADRGWRVIGRFTDKSVSASSGEPRPGYDAMMAGIKAGRAQGIVVRHYDRLYRQPRELEGLIDSTEGVHIEAVYGGGYDLGTADGRVQARVVGAFARGEAEKKAERQRLGARRDAEAGKARKGCPRPFGWQDNRVTAHPEEGPAVAAGCRALLAGGTVSGVCRDWAARGVRPAQAPYGPLVKMPWTRASVVTILKNPRIAGLATYCGAEVGHGEWEPLVNEETFRAVNRLLSDPSRKPSQGVRTMLGGLARCQCGNHVTANTITRGSRAWQVYRCNPVTRGGKPGPHVSVRADVVDAFIGVLVMERLSEDDAADLLAPKADPSRARALHDEAAAIRSRLKTLGPTYVRGDITEQDMIAGRAEGDRRLTEIATEMEDLGRESVLAPLIAAENTEKAWKDTPTDRRRAVVDALMTVTLHPAGRGARTIAPRSVIKVTRRGVTSV
jgi:site-specific DNA recombinase